MHQGVVRDIEQQRIKRERALDFEMQRLVEEEYRKVHCLYLSVSFNLPNCIARKKGRTSLELGGTYGFFTPLLEMHEYDGA